MTTIGAELLKERFLTQAEVARRVGVSQQSVSRWVAGEKRPDPERRIVIEREFGIPADAWLTAEERDAEKREFTDILTDYLRKTQTVATRLIAAIARKTL